MSFKILACGDREWTDRWSLYRCLDSYRDQHPDIEIISGMARGADRIAADWAIEHRLPLHECWAEWKTYGKAAGPIRNKVMLDLSPDLVLAFHDNIEASKGTAHMLLIAQKIGTPTILISRPQTRRLKPK